MCWTKEQDTAIKQANGKFKAWLDHIGLKKGMSQKEPLPGASESVTTHRLVVAASLMQMKKEDGEPLFPQNEYYTKVRLNLSAYPTSHASVSPCKLSSKTTFKIATSKHPKPVNRQMQS
jgi:hypothetical protein